MTAVARVLPRDWDGRRLLRFLTGLAMLALAFATHLAPSHLTTAASVAPAAPAHTTSPAVAAAQPESAFTGLDVAVVPAGTAEGATLGTAGNAALGTAEGAAFEGAKALSASPSLLAVGVMVVPAAPIVPLSTLVTTVAAILLLSCLWVRNYAVRGPPFN